MPPALSDERPAEAASRPGERTLRRAPGFGRRLRPGHRATLCWSRRSCGDRLGDPAEPTGPAGARAPVPAPRAPVPAPRAPVPAPRAPVPAPRAPVPAPRAPVPAGARAPGASDTPIAASERPAERTGPDRDVGTAEPYAPRRAAPPRRRNRRAAGATPRRATRRRPPRRHTSGARPRAYQRTRAIPGLSRCDALHHDVDLRIVRRCPTSRISGTDAGSPSSRSEKALNDEDPHESFPHPRRAHRTGGLRPGPPRGACHRGPASELPRRARRVAGGAPRVRPIPLRAAPRDADAADPRADRPRGLAALPVRAGHGDAQPDRAAGGPPAGRGRPRPRVGLPRRA